MAASRVYKTEAIVLKHLNSGEADRIVVLYTPNLGKLRALVRGARKPRSKLGGHVEPLVQCSLVVARGRNLDTVTQSQAVDSFASIRGSLWLTAQGLYLVELVDAFTADNMENYPLYKLLLDALRQLQKGKWSDVLLRRFELQLLGTVGYRPQLRQCLNCQRPVAPVENCFSASGGGVLCAECAHTEPVVQPISVDALKVLRLLQGSDYASAVRLCLSPGLSREVERLVQGNIRYLLERELRSTHFLDRLRREGAAVS